MSMRKFTVGAILALGLLAAACGEATGGSVGVAGSESTEPTETITEDPGSAGSAAGGTVLAGTPTNDDASRCAADGPDCVDPNSVPTVAEPGQGMAMCAEGHPDCNDMVVVTEQPSDCPPEGCTAWTDVPVNEDAEGTPHSVHWDSVVTDPASTDIAVRWWSGVEPCSTLQRIDVVETDTTVTITVYEASDHPDDADVACIDIAQAKQQHVQLAAPLGERTVVDGAA